MPVFRLNWENWPVTTTPLSAENLNQEFLGARAYADELLLSSALKKGTIDPIGADALGLYEKTGVQPTTLFWNGSPVQVNYPGSSSPFPLGRQPVIVKTADFELTANEWGYLVQADSATDITCTIRIDDVNPLPGTFWCDVESVNAGTVRFAVDNGVVTDPALPLAVPREWTTVRVYSKAINSIGIDNAMGLMPAAKKIIDPKISGPVVGGTVVNRGAVLTLDSVGGYLWSNQLSVLNWQRGGVDIGAATNFTYTTVAADDALAVRARLRMKSAQQGGETADFFSNAITVQAPAGVAPSNTGGAPLVSSPTGSFITGTTISTTSGGWSNNPTNFTYKWQSKVGAGAYTDIPGETTSTYTLRAADEGNIVRSVVTASNNFGSNTANSADVLPQAAVATSAATKFAADMQNYQIGQALNTANPTREAAPEGAASMSWAYRPRIPSATPLNSVRSGQYVRLQMWLVLYQQEGGQPTQARVVMSDLQTWVQYNSGEWFRGDYSPGGGGDLFTENFATNSTTPAVRSGGNGSPVIVHLGPNPPAGVAANPPGLLYHGWCPNSFDTRTQTGTRSAANIRRVLVAMRVRLEPANFNAGAKYVCEVGCDRKGPNWEQGFDACMGKFLIPGKPVTGTTLDTSWRVVSAESGDNPLDFTGPYPALSGVLDASEYH